MSVSLISLRCEVRLVFLDHSIAPVSLAFRRRFPSEEVSPSECDKLSAYISLTVHRFSFPIILSTCHPLHFHNNHIFYMCTLINHCRVSPQFFWWLPVLNSFNTSTDYMSSWRKMSVLILCLFLTGIFLSQISMIS